MSNYPIFVAFDNQITLGIELLSKDQVNAQWSFNATTLEELVTKNIIPFCFLLQKVKYLFVFVKKISFCFQVCFLCSPRVSLFFLSHLIAVCLHRWFGLAIDV